MTLRETMARAVYYRHHGGRPALPWERLAPLFRDGLLADADAVLDAMIEVGPTEAMEEAAKPFRKGVGEGAGRLLRAMLTAAKEER